VIAWLWAPDRRDLSSWRSLDQLWGRVATADNAALR
jgi:hypothetical protein